jgi:hypothetical protein
MPILTTSAVGAGYAVACPSVTECAAVGGGETVFNPQSPGNPTVTTFCSFCSLDSVACPALTQCTAVAWVSHSGIYAFTVNPTAPEIPSGEGIGGYEPGNVVCPSAVECVTVNFATPEAITFNPTVSGTAAGSSICGSCELTSVSCPSTSQCTAVDTAGQELTFNPAVPGTPTPEPIDYGMALNSIACPSVEVCLAVDQGRAVEFDPFNANGWTVEPLSGAGTLTSITCASATECVAVDSIGHAFVATDVAPTTGGSQPGGSGQPGESPPGESATTAVTHLLKETVSSKERSATFHFKAIGGSTGFQCALVKKASHGNTPAPKYARCTSPKTFKDLKIGSYSFYVRATATGGVKGAPVVRKFTIT